MTQIRENRFRSALRRSLIVLAALAVLPSGGGPATAQTVMKLAHDSPLDSGYQIGAEWFKQELESRSGGRIQVQIFPNAQLGDEATMINGLKIGAVDAMYTSSGPISASVPQVDLFSLPFLFKDADHAVRVANGPVGETLNPMIEAAIGARVVGWSSQGERDMWNGSHPIKTLADMQGLKMRIQQSSVQADTYSALGAQPTPLPFSELYTALQTGVVDGADAGPADVEQQKFYQVTKYMTLTRHFILLNPMLLSSSFLAKLSPEDQQLVMEVGQQSVQLVTDTAKKQNSDSLAKLGTLGLEILELSDGERQAFVDAVQGVYAKNADHVGGQALIQQALDTP
jgi:tripartite ATP-independent transporter DctP family solute receptor